MPYPFAKAPTAGSLIQKFCQDFGATLEATRPVTGPRGEAQIRYLRRTTDNGPSVSGPLPDSDDELVGWDMVRRLCRQLGVDPKDLDIGLDLG